MPHLDLDYSAGHISPPLEPTPDDQGLVNDVLATRPDGGEARATLESGPLSVQDPPDGVGLYQRQLDVNVDSDGRLPDVAGWALHNGAWDDPHDRFPLIRTNLRRLSKTPYGLLLDGEDGTFASTPDGAALDITGDLDIRIALRVEGWEREDFKTLAAKWENAGNQRSWLLWVTNVNSLQFSWSEDGTAAGLTSEVPATTWQLLTPRAIRVTLDVDNGSGGRTITFYTGTSISGPWTQIFQDVQTSGTTSVFSSSAALNVGALTTSGTAPLPAVVEAFELRNGIDGTVVADPSFVDAAVGTSSFDDDSGNTWTVQGGAFIAAWDYVALIPDAGSRVTVHNPPDWLPPEDIDQLALGYSESIAVDEWTQDWHTTPVGPLRVATVAAGHVIGSDSSVLNSPIDATQTTIPVLEQAPGNTIVWTHERDFDIVVGGERMTVTAVGAPDPFAQTFTVIRSVNGVVKAHPAATPVELFHQTYIGL